MRSHFIGANVGGSAGLLPPTRSEGVGDAGMAEAIVHQNEATARLGCAGVDDGVCVVVAGFDGGSSEDVGDLIKSEGLHEVSRFGVRTGPVRLAIGFRV